MNEAPKLKNITYECDFLRLPHPPRLDLTFELKDYPHPRENLEVVIGLKGRFPHLTEQRVLIPLSLFFQRGRQVQEYLPGPFPDPPGEDSH